MKIKENTNSIIERSIITALIISSDFNKRINSYIRIEYMQTQIAQIVTRWCLDYFKDYKKAPGKEIERIFTLESSNLTDEMSELINKFLSSISKEYSNELFDWEHILDRSIEYCKKQNASILAKKISSCVENDSIEEAYREIEKFNTQEIKADIDSSTAFDDEKNSLIFAEDYNKPLFGLRGKIGSMINEHLVRGGFICFFGEEKIGKSHILDTLALSASKGRCNVVLFDCGDNTEKQRRARLSVKLTGIPIDPKYCGTFQLPVLDCYSNQMKECKHEWRAGGKNAPGLFNIDSKGNKSKLTPEEASWDGYQICDECRRNGHYHDFIPEIYWDEVTIEKPLSRDKSKESWDKLQKIMKGKDFKIKCFSLESLTLSMIKSMLYYWKQEEFFVPDVIIVDYADALGSDNNKKIEIEQINEKWSGLRALSQEQDCLVITCSHVNRAGYDEELKSRKSVSADRRKLAHLTAAFSLNQKEEEKADGIMRIAVMLAREGEWNAHHQVRVLQSLRIGKPILNSY